MSDRELIEALVTEVQALRREVGALRAMWPDRLISITELEAQVREGKRTIYRRVKERRLTPVPRQNGTYFLPEEVQRAIDAGVLHRTGAKV